MENQAEGQEIYDLFPSTNCDYEDMVRTIWPARTDYLIQLPGSTKDAGKMLSVVWTMNGKKLKNGPEERMLKMQIIEFQSFIRALCTYYERKTAPSSATIETWRNLAGSHMTTHLEKR